MTRKCVYCGEDVDPDGLNTYQRTQGWVKRRAQGGPNAIKLRETIQEWACWECIDKRVRGVEGQSSLM